MKVNRAGIAAVLFSSSLFAAPVELPRPSPAASVFEKIGTARLTVTYSRPAVKGREVWGGLVPYGQVWRLGANDATTLEVSEACKLAGHDLPAGSYALFAIPAKDSWTIVVDSQAKQWGAYFRDPKKDVFSFDVTPWVDELKGDLLADSGKYAEAAPWLEKAIEGSKKAGAPEEWRDGARKKLAEWAAKGKSKA